MHYIFVQQIKRSLFLLNFSMEISGQFHESTFHRAKFEDQWICKIFDKTNIRYNSLNRLSVAFAEHKCQLGTSQIY